jgi:hypothetical protein
MKRSEVVVAAASVWIKSALGNTLSAVHAKEATRPFFTIVV